MQRAAISIPSNVAEGSERGGKDFIRFLSIARGSAAELRTQCYIACKVSAVSNDDMNSLVAELKESPRCSPASPAASNEKLNTEN